MKLPAFLRSVFSAHGYRDFTHDYSTVDQRPVVAAITAINAAFAEAEHEIRRRSHDENWDDNWSGWLDRVRNNADAEGDLPAEFVIPPMHATAEYIERMVRSVASAIGNTVTSPDEMISLTEFLSSIEWTLKEHVLAQHFGWVMFLQFGENGIEERALNRFLMFRIGLARERALTSAWERYRARLLPEGERLSTEAKIQGTRADLSMYRNRASWLAEQLLKHGWGNAEPAKWGGPDRKTVEKILDGIVSAGAKIPIIPVEK